MKLEPLPDHDRQRLAHCERLIDAGVGAYYQMGLALREIQTGKLYRADYGSFETYLEKRWGLQRSTAYRCIGAAVTTRALIDGGEDSPPQKESQVRPMVGLDDNSAREAWHAARDMADGRQPTARQVAEAVARVEKKGSDNWTKAYTSSESNEYGTPHGAIEATRALFGGAIDLDPASSEAFNARVGAIEWIGLPDDGLARQWHGRVMVNPPYGKVESGESRTGQWLAYARNQVEVGNCEAVLFWSPSHIGRPWLSPIWRHLVCIFDERQPHARPDGSVAGQPTHGNLAVLITQHPRAWHSKFVEHFRRFGPIAPCIADFSRMR